MPAPISEPLRILHLVSYWLYSGPLPPTLGLALAQRRQGHGVEVAFDRVRALDNPYEEPAAPRVMPTGLASPMPLALSTKSSPRQLLTDLRGLRRVLGEERWDVVHCHLSHDHSLAAWARPRRASVALVRTYHAARSLERRWGQRRLARSAEGSIVRSEAHRQRFEISFPQERSPRVIPAGIDGQVFTPASERLRARARRRFGLPADARVVGQVALMADRGQRELLQAVASLAEPTVWVLLVGRGEQEQALKDEAVALGLGPRVVFTGYVSGSSLLEVYAAMDAAFVAQAGNDASARAVLEAMACGVPTLAVQAGALAESVAAARGYPVPARTPEAIAAALQGWLRDPDSEARGAAGRRWVMSARTFDQEAERTEALYRAALARRRVGRSAPAIAGARAP